MVKLLKTIALATLLSGCSDSEGGGVSPNSEVAPQLHASANALTSAGAPVHDADADPEARNGLVKTPLTGRAFTVRDFGSAPEGNASAVIHRLEPLASAGDGKASYEIYLKIDQCMPLKGASGGSRLSLDAKGEEECSDLPPEYLATRSDWLRLAAEQGHLGAQLMFVADPEQVIGGPAEIFKDPDAVVEYKRQAMDYLESAAYRGSIDALLQLGNAYQIGVMADQDNVTSYAYYLAAQRAAPGMVSSTRLQLLRDGLNAGQLRESNIKAKEFYDECCARNQLQRLKKDEDLGRN
jgi:hypothetical protein